MMSERENIDRTFTERRIQKLANKWFIDEKNPLRDTTVRAVIKLIETPPEGLKDLERDAEQRRATLKIEHRAELKSFSYIYGANDRTLNDERNRRRMLAIESVYLNADIYFEEHPGFEDYHRKKFMREAIKFAISTLQHK